jgi:hypothetical protein
MAEISQSNKYSKISKIFERRYKVRIELVSNSKMFYPNDKYLKTIVSRHSQAENYDMPEEALTREGVKITQKSARELSSHLLDSPIVNLASSRAPRARQTLKEYVVSNNLPEFGLKESEFLSIPSEINDQILNCYREIQTLGGPEMAKRYTLQKLTDDDNLKISEKSINVIPFPLSSSEYASGHAFALLNRVYEFAELSSDKELDIAVGHSMSLWFFMDTMGFDIGDLEKNAELGIFHIYKSETETPVRVNLYLEFRNQKYNLNIDLLKQMANLGYIRYKNNKRK